MSEKRDLITSRNLLAGLDCSVCNFQRTCISKLREKYNTCGKFSLLKEIKLGVSWTQMKEPFVSPTAEDLLIEIASKEIEKAIDEAFLRNLDELR